MRRSSKIILAICFVLVAALVAVYVPAIMESQPEMSPKLAQEMLDKLADAFARKNVGDVVSFASPDAQIAGRKLKDLQDYLKKGFANVKNLKVEFRDLKYTRNNEDVLLDTNVAAGDSAEGTKEFNANVYNANV